MCLTKVANIYLIELVKGRKSNNAFDDVKEKNLNFA